ncbi:filamentous hemagglutinin N-terminal domain-containing protein [Pseudanabaena sp. FACHB-1998]|uniref:two-partner secretion domain-containing protein n=1 Tax=Pseudanabaena sp. FACHB-1998 TaxID=2692858 RepID=UPI0016810768|nr:filamentous hemagglutinin N-terminal domain-containing protein [Pseudanabaena sp. FACHB-1998]MBD2178725.1 filamentous hemagglutinin N-terminal domain-containing protein [Pseudanabaena sp. FACHB-1998]
MAAPDRLKLLFVIVFASLVQTKEAYGQIIPDATTGTQIIPNILIQGVLSDLVETGTLRGSNLFHSFSELNIANNRGLYFNNPATVTNIFARVTGNNPSNILGRLGVLGNANLFLLNPNGVLFGENSSLSLSGSLYVTTGDRLRFADGTTFSTNNPEPSALLTSSIPIGLGFGTNNSNAKGAITVRSQADPIFPLPLPPEILPVIRPPSGLILLPSSTIALVGNAVNVENNGSLFILGGEVELGGVRNGEVALSPYGNRFTLSYENVKKFGNIQVSDQASVSNIGAQEGQIKLIGDRVLIRDKGLVLTTSLSPLFNGKISVQANSLIELVGSNNYEKSVKGLTSFNPDLKTINGLFSFSVGNGNGGDISLKTSQLIAQNSSFIVSSILFDGRAGNITINAPESITLNSGAIFSGTAATATGSSGSIGIQTGHLILRNNSAISSTILGSGQEGGNVTIEATKSVEIFGSSPIFSAQDIAITTGIITTTVNKAIAGNITVNTPFLSLLNGAVLTTETRGGGKGGAVTILADRLYLSGIDPSQQVPSAILAVTRESSTGDGGNVNITAKEIKIQDRAGVSVASFGFGDAGGLSITANNLSLNRQGSLAALSLVGAGGNINLQIRDLLSLNNSLILSASEGTENSGNINLNAGIVVGLNRSEINASSFGGNGGNIFIKTQGLFFSPDSLITASSQLGISGNVAISNLDLTPKNAFVSSVENFVKVDAIVSNSCLARRNAAQGSFVVTGSGGLPENPYNLLVAEYPATKIQPIPSMTKSPSPVSSNPASISDQALDQDNHPWQLGDPIVEIRGLKKGTNGEILPVVTYADARSLGCTEQPNKEKF